MKYVAAFSVAVLLLLFSLSAECKRSTSSSKGRGKTSSSGFSWNRPKPAPQPSAPQPSKPVGWSNPSSSNHRPVSYGDTQSKPVGWNVPGDNRKTSYPVGSAPGGHHGAADSSRPIGWNVPDTKKTNNPVQSSATGWNTNAQKPSAPPAYNPGAPPPYSAAGAPAYQQHANPNYGFQSAKYPGQNVNPPAYPGSPGHQYPGAGGFGHQSNYPHQYGGGGYHAPGGFGSPGGYHPPGGYHGPGGYGGYHNPSYVNFGSGGSPSFFGGGGYGGYNNMGNYKRGGLGGLGTALAFGGGVSTALLGLSLYNLAKGSMGGHGGYGSYGGYGGQGGAPINIHNYYYGTKEKPWSTSTNNGFINDIVSNYTKDQPVDGSTCIFSSKLSQETTQCLFIITRPTDAMIRLWNSTFNAQLQNITEELKNATVPVENNGTAVVLAPDGSANTTVANASIPVNITNPFEKPEQIEDICLILVNTTALNLVNGTWVLITNVPGQIHVACSTDATVQLDKSGAVIAECSLTHTDSPALTPSFGTVEVHASLDFTLPIYGTKTCMVILNQPINDGQPTRKK